MDLTTCLLCDYLNCSVLQGEIYVPGVEDTIVACLDKIFKTKYGASLLPNFAVCISIITYASMFLFLFIFLFAFDNLIIMNGAV